MTKSINCLTDKQIDIILQMKDDAASIDNSDNASECRVAFEKLLRLKDDHGVYLYEVEYITKEIQKIQHVIEACSKKILNIEITAYEEDLLVWFMTEPRWDYFKNLLEKYSEIYKEVTGEELND